MVSPHFRLLDLNDRKGAGWLWVKATSKNPVDWTPSDFEDDQWTAYQINSPTYVSLSPSTSQTGSGSSDNTDTWGIIAFVLLAIIVSVIRLMVEATAEI